MDTAELKALKKKITRLTERLDLLRSVSNRMTATATEARDSESSAEIANIREELERLSVLWDNAIGRLSYDDDTANCIYLHYAAGYTWQQIANLTDGIPDTAAGIRMRCRRYRW